ncbi:MAG: hypothetical protein RL204_934, partial [Bacteroidota bacterium]
MANYLIVGGTSGIGEAIVENLTEQGNNIITLSRNPNSNESNHLVQHLIWDATNSEVPALELTHLDGLVYCPGTINLKPFHRYSDEEIL